MESKNITKKKTSRIILIILAIPILLIGICIGLTLLFFKSTGELLTKPLSEPLSDTRTAEFIIDQGDGNLTIDSFINSDHLLATGSLQYFENSGAPVSSMSINQGLSTYTLTASTEQTWQRLPWAPCNGATEWEIHLNPLVTFDISTHTGGGNVKLDLTGLNITHLEAETGAGNMEIILPDQSVNLKVTAKTGAGKVSILVGNDLIGRNSINANSGAGEMTIIVPAGVAARVDVMKGEVNVSAPFIMMDDTSYETPEFAGSTDKLEIVVGSGMGKVNIIFDTNPEV
jgi:hypothetical protein